MFESAQRTWQLGQGAAARFWRVNRSTLADLACLVMGVLLLIYGGWHLRVLWLERGYPPPPVQPTEVMVFRGDDEVLPATRRPQTWFGELVWVRNQTALREHSRWGAWRSVSLAVNVDRFYWLMQQWYVGSALGLVLAGVGLLMQRRWACWVGVTTGMWSLIHLALICSLAVSLEGAGEVAQLLRFACPPLVLQLLILWFFGWERITELLPEE